MTRTKKPKAPWMSAYPDQAAKLRPERSKSGGVKGRSGSKAVRDAVYSAINQIYRLAHPWCECCDLIWEGVYFPAHTATDTHHMRGKEGLLYFDVRYFKSACRKAHDWIGANPESARNLGLLCQDGEWGKQS